MNRPALLTEPEAAEALRVCTRTLRKARQRLERFGMQYPEIVPKWMRALLGLGAIGIAANEIRGLIMAAPVIYGLWLSGGTFMAWWIALCSLGGIALSVIVPVWLLRKLRA